MFKCKRMANNEFLLNIVSIYHLEALNGLFCIHIFLILNSFKLAQLSGHLQI